MGWTLHLQQSIWPISGARLEAPEVRVNWWNLCLPYEFDIYYLDQ